jgi:hypothetical protein
VQAIGAENRVPPQSATPSLNPGDGHALDNLCQESYVASQVIREAEEARFHAPGWRDVLLQATALV